MRTGLVPTLIAALAVTAAAAPAEAAAAHARHTTGGWAYADPQATPGAVLTTDAATVCRSGYSASVRAVSDSLKAKVYAEYGITSHQPYQYEVDHDISLELGGSNDIRNLWPEPNDRPRGNTKDKLENKLHQLVCSGQMTLPTAQHLIRGNWTGAYRTYIGPLGNYHPNKAGSSSSKKSSSSSVYYANCTAVRNAGKAPLHRGQPGYRAGLDRDGDGIACE